jgi:hypothetical protein
MMTDPGFPVVLTEVALAVLLVKPGRVNASKYTLKVKAAAGTSEEAFAKNVTSSLTYAVDGLALKLTLASSTFSESALCSGSNDEES